MGFCRPPIQILNGLSEVKGPFGKGSLTFLTVQGMFIWLTKLAEFESASSRPGRGTPAHHRVLVTYSAYESIEHTLHMGFLFLSGFSHKPICSFRRQDTSAVVRAWMSVDELRTSPKLVTKLQTSEQAGIQSALQAKESSGLEDAKDELGR